MNWRPTPEDGALSTRGPVEPSRRLMSTSAICALGPASSASLRPQRSRHAIAASSRIRAMSRRQRFRLRRSKLKVSVRDPRDQAAPPAVFVYSRATINLQFRFLFLWLLGRITDRRCRRHQFELSRKLSSRLSSLGWSKRGIVSQRTPAGRSFNLLLLLIVSWFTSPALNPCLIELQGGRKLGARLCPDARCQPPFVFLP